MANKKNWIALRHVPIWMFPFNLWGEKDFDACVINNAK